MSLAQWKADVIERLAYGTDEIPGFGPESVFREGVVDEATLPRFDNANPKPYAVVWFGQRALIRNDYSACGILGSAHRMFMIVQSCAYHGVMVDQAVDLTSNLLLGFRPAGQGELHEDSSMTIRRPLDISGARSRYTIPTSFSGIVDI